MLKLGIECEIQKNKKNHLIKVPKEFVGKETDFDCEGEIINSERSLKCILTKQENENLEIKLRLIEYIDIPNKIKDLYKRKNDISLKIRDLRNNIIDIYNHSSVIEKLEEKHLQESKSELENSLPTKMSLLQKIIQLLKYQKNIKKILII